MVKVVSGKSLFIAQLEQLRRVKILPTGHPLFGY